jgi:hemoglobin
MAEIHLASPSVFTRMSTRRFPPWLALALALLTAGACASAGGAGGPGAGGGSAVTAPPGRPLIDRLGGKPAVEAVVDDFLGRVAIDNRINGRFANVDMPRLRTMLVDQICEAAGGPCKYLGRDMRTTHTGMNITEGEWNALVEDLKASLDYLEVPAQEQGELMSVLGPMKPDVVGLGPAAPGSPAVSAVPRPAPAIAAGGPVSERAQGLREAATLLDKAGEARQRGSRSLAEQLFSSAEIITGPEPLEALAPLFREGAPPRVTAPVVPVPLTTPAQPKLVGSSDEEDGAAASARPRASLTGEVRFGGTAPAENIAVITLEPVDGRFRKRPPRTRVIEQRNREFAPRVLAVPVGSTVGFPNFDSIYHNVFSRSESHPFDLGIYRGGVSREVKLEREGILRVGCNLHANMRAYVVAVSAPHYVITDGAGKFRFRSVEPGRYRLRAYSERTEAPSVQEIVIGKGDNSVTVALAATVPDGPLADKFGNSRAAAKVQRR